MNTQKIYGPWIDWNGGECPVPRDQEVVVKLRSGVVLGSGRAVGHSWGHYDDLVDIMEYCTVTEQPDLDAAKSLLLSHGYAITPPAKPLTCPTRRAFDSEAPHS